MKLAAAFLVAMAAIMLYCFCIACTGYLTYVAIFWLTCSEGLAGFLGFFAALLSALAGGILALSPLD